MAQTLLSYYILSLFVKQFDYYPYYLVLQTSYCY